MPVSVPLGCGVQQRSRGGAHQWIRTWSICRCLPLHQRASPLSSPLGC